MGVIGIHRFFTGIRFPIENGYILLTKSGGFSPNFAGSGAVVEAAGLLHTGVISGIAFELRFQPNSMPVQKISAEQ